MYPKLRGKLLADFWNERLKYDPDEIYWGYKYEFFFVVIAFLAAGLVAKLPSIFPINDEFFYTTIYREEPITNLLLSGCYKKGKGSVKLMRSLYLLKNLIFNF